MAKISTYTRKQGVSLPTGTGFTAATQRAKLGSSSADLGKSLLEIGNTLLQAGSARKNNVRAGANVKMLLPKIGDESFRVGLDRDLLDIPQKAMDAGGNWFVATKELSEKYGLDFGNKASAKAIFTAMESQYRRKMHQFEKDKTGYILSSIPGAKELVDGLSQNDQSYHENLQLIAAENNIKLDNGFDTNFLNSEATKYAALNATGKYAYLQDKEKTMGKDVFHQFLKGMSQTDGGIPQTDYFATNLDQTGATKWFNANAKEDDISQHEFKKEINEGAQEIAGELLPLLYGGHQGPRKEFVTKFKQLIYQYMGDGHSAAAATKLVKDEIIFKDMKHVKNDMTMVGIINKRELSEKFGANLENIESFMDYAHMPVVRRFVIDYVYDDLTKDMPELEQEVKDMFPGASDEVLQKEVENFKRKKITSTMMENMRLVNTQDHSLGFAVQINEVFDFYNEYSKTGDEIYIPFEEIAKQDVLRTASLKYGTEDTNDFNFVPGLFGIEMSETE